MFGSRSTGYLFDAHPTRGRRAVAAVAVLLALTLQCHGLRAELLFRSVEQVNGQPRWSPIRHYGDPADTAQARANEGDAPAPAMEVRVFLSGEITRADVESSRVMASLYRTGRQKIVGNAVWLASNGGDIDAAMELGRLLRELGVFTLVGKSDQCLSACVFAFMGGERRIVAGRLGIHRPFFPFTQNTPVRRVQFRLLQKTLKDYIEELDFPFSLYEAMMAVPPESMKILAAAELKRFYLDGISPTSEDAADAASARRLGLTMAEYLQRKAKLPACAFLVPALGKCGGDALEAAASGGAADDPGGIHKREAAPTGRAVGHGNAR